MSALTPWFCLLATDFGFSPSFLKAKKSNLLLHWGWQLHCRRATYFERFAFACACFMTSLCFLFGAHHWLDSTMKNMCTWYILYIYIYDMIYIHDIYDIYDIYIWYIYMIYIWYIYDIYIYDIYIYIYISIIYTYMIYIYMTCVYIYICMWYIYRNRYGIYIWYIDCKCIYDIHNVYWFHTHTHIYI